MKITAHASLESMMGKALREIEIAYQNLMKAKINMLANREGDSYKLYCEAQIEVDNASERYSELLTARKIIKEMEAKGVEI
ncbi:MAG: hypothetical protein K2M56_09640 [Muribaculaceae bacterium]|nr:hypothetical protein [Muribaculaceae bacterium]